MLIGYECGWGVQKLTGDKLKVVWAKFSSSSKVVLVMSVTAWHTQERPHLELKTRPWIHHDSLSLSMVWVRMHPVLRHSQTCVYTKCTEIGQI